MKLINFIFVSAQCYCVFGGLTSIREGRIIGGHESVPHSRPYQVSLQLRVLFFKLHICGGSLLNENWVLTAGHCIKGSWLVSWLPIDAVAGTHDVNHYGPNTQLSTVKKRIPHPLYDGGIGAHDIALLKTATPFTLTDYVQPVRLPQVLNKFDDTNSLFVLTGWGALRTSFFPDLPNKLQEVNVPLITYEECYEAVEKVKEPHEENPLDESSNICTGPLTGGIAACNGDSGGPLVQITKNNVDTEHNNSIDTESEEALDNEVGESEETSNKLETSKLFKMINKDAVSEDIPVILGVVSWGASPCGNEGAPTVYTKVSTHLDFINSHISQ